MFKYHMDIDEILNNKHVEEISKILENIGERVEGNLICDIKPRNYIISKTINKITLNKI